MANIFVDEAVVGDDELVLARYPCAYGAYACGAESCVDRGPAACGRGLAGSLRVGFGDVYSAAVRGDG